MNIKIRKAMLLNFTPLQAAYRKRYAAFLDYKDRHLWLFRTFQILSLLILVAVLTIAVFVGSIANGAFGEIPTQEELIAIQNPIGSEVLSTDGVLMGKYYIEDRLSITLEDISPEVINALVATEDARFFQHTGVDFRSWMRVFFKTILMKDRSSGGGSTLSQQLAKNLYPRRDYDYMPLVINKLREVFIARRMEQLYSKEELLQLYLNTVSFSDNTYGIRVAAKRFFNKSPKALKAEEAACLVAMLKATSVYHPLKNPKASQARRNVVLEQMQRYGYLNAAQRDSLQQMPIAINYQAETHNDGLATYFRESLRLELKDWLEDYNKEHKTNYNLYTSGLRISTTINARMQQMAEKAVQIHLSGLQEAFDEHWEGEERPWEDERLLNLSRQQSNRYKILKAAALDDNAIDSIFNLPIEMTVFDWKEGEKKVKMSPMDSIRYYFKMLNAGFLAMEPQSGYVRAWVGGTNYKYFKYDHVRSERQVGSTFKPLVYAAAIKKGIHPCDYIGNRLVTYSRYENWQPKNADHRYGGYYSMEGALSKSINAITVNLIMRTRADSVAALAQRMGIETEIPAVPSIALGAAEIPLLDMVNAYGTFANRGKRVTPVYITKIEDAKGNILLQQAAENVKTSAAPLTTDEADMMNEMLQTTVNRGTGIRLRYRYKFETPLAGKTGTSQNHSDGWFMGYTPALVTGTWVGAESPSVYFRDLSLGQGANTALPVFAEFWKQMLAEEQFDRYTKASFPEISLEARSKLNCGSYVSSDSTYQKIVEEVKAAELVTNTPQEAKVVAATLVSQVASEN
ncbi:MAG: transglycosylase domain-containing protein [Bacteroidota bacterium]